MIFLRKTQNNLSLPDTFGPYILNQIIMLKNINFVFKIFRTLLMILIQIATRAGKLKFCHQVHIRGYYSILSQFQKKMQEMNCDLSFSGNLSKINIVKSI